MGEAIGQTLPLTIGLLASPMPIVAVVMMLTSKTALANGIAFVVGWVIGIGALGTLVLLVSAPASDSGGEQPTWLSVLKLILGAGLLFLAFRQWRNRPAEGAAPEPPKWMAAIDTVAPPKAFGLAVLLGAVNPKNLLIVVSAATTIAHATGDRGEQLVALVVFTVLASAGVATPVVIYLAMGSGAPALLDRLRTWLVAHNTAILLVLLVVLGTKLIGDGVSGLF